MIIGALLTILLILCCVLLVGIILLQRGRGGGLSGAFGVGGVETAFGTKATTLAQKITVVLGVLLIVLTLAAGVWRARQANRSVVDAPASPVPPASKTPKAPGNP